MKHQCFLHNKMTEKKSFQKYQWNNADALTQRNRITQKNYLKTASEYHTHCLLDRSRYDLSNYCGRI